MSNEINIYCDESCHLEKSQERIMLLSCIYCSKDKVSYIVKKIKELKEKHGIWKFAEIKWKKVSESKKDFYLDVLNLFLEESYLNFRTVIIDKNILNPEKYPQKENISWYYSMVYVLTKYIIDKNIKWDYFIYLDKKENSAKSKNEIRKTRDYLHKRYKKKIQVQNILSHQSDLMQLADFIQGIVSFYNRQLYVFDDCSSAKKQLMEYLISSLNIELDKSNNNSKFNIFKWGLYR